MYRLGKTSDTLDSSRSVQLTSFNHTNGESAASLQHPQNQFLRSKIRRNHGSSQTEILGPTGTVRGFKNIITQRKEFLRMSFVGETLQVGHSSR